MKEETIGFNTMDKAVSPLALVPASSLDKGGKDSANSSDHRRVLVIYVGGTIGMKRNSMGALEPCKGYLTEKMKSMRELKESSLVAKFDIMECDPLLDSSDMNGEDYWNIGKNIYDNYADYSGFLILIGTDTMHYATAALSFLLYNLGKPVIFTGAMIPLAMPFNDARRNLIIGMILASTATICEVGLFFNDSLFRGTRVDKIRHTFGAFDSLGYDPLLVVTGKEFLLRWWLLLPQPTGSPQLLSTMRGRVCAFRMNPVSDIDSLVEVLECNDEKAKLDGLVLVLDGVGSEKGTMSKNLQRIEMTTKKKNVVVCLTTVDPRKTLSTAEVQRLQRIVPSFVYLFDMCVSAAEMKLMYLFGKGLPPQEVTQLMPLNLRGEVTPRSLKSNL